MAILPFIFLKPTAFYAMPTQILLGVYSKYKLLAACGSWHLTAQSSRTHSTHAEEPKAQAVVVMNVEDMQEDNSPPGGSTAAGVG